MHFKNFLRGSSNQSLEAGDRVLSVLAFLTLLSAVTGYALTNYISYASLQNQPLFIRGSQGFVYESSLMI